jgi:phosphatidylglycerophosphate synthase
MLPPVALYIPNLLAYARIILAFVGLHFADTRPRLAVGTWIFSASLDLIDGILARALHQTSSLGILLDIAADNVLRTTIWVATATTDQLRLVACIVISLEWITMLATQLHATQSGTHWKATRENDPWIVRAIFANNFRRPMGIWTIYGLFTAGLFAYMTPHKDHFEMIPYFNTFKYLAYSGRVLSSLVEIWLTLGYLGLVIERDTTASKKHS